MDGTQRTAATGSGTKRELQHLLARRAQAQSHDHAGILRTGCLIVLLLIGADQDDGPIGSCHHVQTDVAEEEALDPADASRAQHQHLGVVRGGEQGGGGILRNQARGQGKAR